MAATTTTTTNTIAHMPFMSQNKQRQSSKRLNCTCTDLFNCLSHRLTKRSTVTNASHAAIANNSKPSFNTQETIHKNNRFHSTPNQVFRIDFFFIAKRTSAHSSHSFAEPWLLSNKTMKTLPRHIPNHHHHQNALAAEAHSADVVRRECLRPTARSHS